MRRRQPSWSVISAKTDGVTPGFVVEDAHKNRYVLKLDPPDYPELSSGADVIGSKAFYALGYNTPENYIVHFRRDRVCLGASSVHFGRGHGHFGDEGRHFGPGGGHFGLLEGRVRLGVPKAMVGSGHEGPRRRT